MGGKRKSISKRTQVHGEKQVISRQYINPSKLERLLNQKFPGEDYQVMLRHDQFTIVASGRLSEQEIIGCA
ncbi:hypothetical protein F5X99DRAFT_392752 [Biscogniauxia marginata]|nr:hypothetical protein F5X99DRAFT_392752 [Biscogniauxia marginata]